MTVVWRGAGIAAFFLGLLGLLLGITLSGWASDDGVNGLLVGLGLVIAGAATFALGWWLNVVSPAKKIEAWTTQRRAQLRDAVSAAAAGQVSPEFAPAPDADARAQSEAVLAQELKQYAKQVRNRHTFFWVPMQWWGVVFAVLGILVAVILSVG